jgi:hypothetical protein
MPATSAMKGDGAIMWAQLRAAAAPAAWVGRLGPAGDEMVGPVCSRARGAWSQAVLMAETSNSRLIFSLTRTPPVSSATFQVTP